MSPIVSIRRISSFTLLAILLSSVAVAQRLDRSSWGPKFASAGASLRFMEMERKPRSDGGTWVNYFLQAIGTPKTGTYTLWEWELGGEPKLLLTGIKLRDDGVLLCSGKSATDCSGATDEQVYVTRLVSMKAEAKQMALVSSDGTVRAFGEDVAFPIAAQDKTCKLSLARITPDATQVTVSGTGFQPKERVTLSVTGEASGTTLRRNADEAGNWSADLSHTADAMHADGETKISVKAKNCALTLPWAWGKSTQVPQ